MTDAVERTAASRPWLRTYAELGLDWAVIPDVPPKSLADYVAEHAARFGDREALVFLGRGISYRELDALSNRLAHVLRGLGCGRGDVLGVHLPNTPQYVVAFVAAAKLGMIVSSISPLLTPTEIEHQANDARVKVLLSLDALFGTVLARLAGKIPTLEHVLLSAPTELVPGAPSAEPKETRLGDAAVHALGAAIALASDEKVTSALAPDDVLFLQYTGGTTGKPKGAQLTLRNIFVNNLQADVFNGYRIGEETIASAYPMFHIGGAAVTYNALRAGATFMVIPDPRNIAHFCAEMKARPPTVLVAVPALFQMLLAEPAFRALDFAPLRLAVSAAAPFSQDEIKRLEAVIGEGKICELYGMTETSPVQTCNPASRFKLGSVGIPVPGTEIRIVDAETGTKDVPLDEPGEIIVHGPQVMKGYLVSGGGSEALRELDGKLWMYTGDIGAMDEEGYLRLCDRSKDMLIVGGYKLFSVEVENKLQALPFIALTAMVGRPDEARPGNDLAVLYVQKKPGTADGDEALRAEILAYCRAHLAPYKVPREIVFVDAIPLTSVGKIDKKALREKARSTPR